MSTTTLLLSIGSPGAAGSAPTSLTTHVVSASIAVGVIAWIASYLRRRAKDEDATR